MNVRNVEFLLAWYLGSILVADLSVGLVVVVVIVVVVVVVVVRKWWWLWVLFCHWFGK